MTMHAMSVRLDAGHKDLLVRLASERRRSQNDIISIALEALAGESATFKQSVDAIDADRRAKVRAAFDHVLERDAVALEMLSR